MQFLLEAMKANDEFQSIVNGLKLGMNEQLITGLSDSARTLAMAALYQTMKRPLVVVTHNDYHAQKLYDDLCEWLSEDEVQLYPGSESIMADLVRTDIEQQGSRAQIHYQLATDNFKVMVIPYSGLRRIVPPKTWTQTATISFAAGGPVPVRWLERLVRFGYERVDKVEDKGQFSIRGGIIDIYPAHLTQPVRIELFDDEIESIRSFTIEDQRSVDKLQQVTVFPCREWVIPEGKQEEVALRLETALQEQLAKTKSTEAANRWHTQISEDIRQLREEGTLSQPYRYAMLIHETAATLLDYFPATAVIVIDEPSRVLDASEQADREEREWKQVLFEEGRLLPALKLSFTYQELFGSGKKRFQMVYFSLFLRAVSQTHPQQVVNLVCRPMQNFHGQIHVLKGELERWRKAGHRVLFTAASEDRLKHLERVLNDYQIETVHADERNPATLTPQLVQGNLSGGWEIPELKWVLVTEGEVFTQKQRKVKKRAKLSNAERIRSYMDLEVGDYVVHVNHGIGRYLGIETLDLGGIHKDYLHIQYAGNDKLYVPVEQIDLVQKYIGSEDASPKIYSLGGNEWARVKNRVKSSVQDIAEDLIKLYAARQQAKGHAFSKDTEFQREFEAMFPYEETPDQLRAIEEIKRDMEQPRPMDRLLCGDVGYGKTEVAIRAAFKAVMDGKQVAVLVPTTILAQQHYETFKERFSQFPITIDVLSRFRSRKEQTQTLKKLKHGMVDIIIGTHRLLGKDVVFKDLGLLIVDEEQRFGVSHKEKLKQLRTNMDVLTLTATPIPRTLHMSMLGVRDLSVIETPPENRFPVQTFVLEYSDTLVREAIEREIARGGQVYFLYNRVKTIQQMADRISFLVPDARVAVAHGQMNENELERVMLDFLEGEYDVLVSTTIIETGVDIPNVNTLIIYDADRMGLSQLYQLRGRVGRSNRVAYAYFTYQKDKVLSEVSEKRLQAIKEFTDLGSGFKIAMRDLAIRGAGNLLGAEQHGFVNQVGFDLYNQMLSEAIEKLKGEQGEESAQPITDPQIELKVDAYIPSEYISDSMQKIEMYKKFASIETLGEVDELADEMDDRFGALPEPVKRLCMVARLKVYARLYRFESVIQKGQEIIMTMAEEQTKSIDGYRLVELANQFSKRVRLAGGQQVVLHFKTQGLSMDEVLDQLLRLMKGFAAVISEQSGGVVDHVEASQ